MVTSVGQSQLSILTIQHEWTFFVITVDSVICIVFRYFFGSRDSIRLFKLTIYR